MKRVMVACGMAGTAATIFFAAVMVRSATELRRMNRRGFGGGSTKDCLDHDACSNRFKSKNRSRDVYCGDEYTAAADDFFRSSSCKG